MLLISLSIRMFISGVGRRDCPEALPVATLPPADPGAQGRRLPLLRSLLLFGGVAFLLGAGAIAFFVTSLILEKHYSPRIMVGSLSVGLLSLLGAAGLWGWAVLVALAPELRKWASQLREANKAAAKQPPSKELQALTSVTLLQELTKAPDQIVLTPAASPLAGAIVLIVGIMFAGGGGFFLGMNLNHRSEIHRAMSMEHPPGARLSNLEVEFLEWGLPALILGVGVLSTLGALWSLWTTRSLIINPERRELIRKIVFRWPAWSWTRSWSASEIDSVYLDEHVTVWPGTPKFWTLWKVEPKETSEGHVWIRLRSGKSVDCGKGAWEEASALASRVAGLLGASKTIRERFEVGPPPSTDTSS
jgi:hypothetical protein